MTEGDRGEPDDAREEGVETEVVPVVPAPKSDDPTKDLLEYETYIAARTEPPSPPPPGAPPPVTAPPTSRSAMSVAEQKSGPSLAIRALWFIFVGWWLTGIVSAVAWFAMITIIGLPLGIWLINRIPTVITLRPRTSTRYAYTDELGRIVAHDVKIDQPPWYVRGLWFVFVGWWASAIAMTVGWFLIVLIITLPIGLMIYNRVPFIASLYRY